MQNRYAGDIGDFGKLGLLRALQDSGLSIGVNWYLVPDETHNDDGKFTQYAYLSQCDEYLYRLLNHIVNSEQRTVSALENKKILSARFYSDLLDFSEKTKSERILYRNQWHEKALIDLAGLDIIFVDPDNGLLVPSAKETKKENKYVKEKELIDYYRQGSSVIYYQHKARKPESFYSKQHRCLINSINKNDSFGFGLKFKKTSLRYFFFIVHPSHQAAVSAAIQSMLSSSWNTCFEWICADNACI